MGRKTVSGTLGASVADAGTFTVDYPDGTSRGNFSLGTGHKLSINQNILSTPADIGLSFGATAVTVTNRTGGALAAGSKYIFEFDGVGSQNPVVVDGVEAYTPLSRVLLNLGSPIAADADGICASQAITAAAGGTINGALASGGAADLGCTGRNVVAAWTTAAVMTVTGTDIYGDALVESSASGTSFTGKKAFKTVTAVSVSTDVTGATVGTGDVLGLPVRVPAAANVSREMEDGATATAGTFVAGLALNTESTATTADVRGTYDPNSACDGSKAFALIVDLLDPAFTGNPQYAG